MGPVAFSKVRALVSLKGYMEEDTCHMRRRIHKSQCPGISQSQSSEKKNYFATLLNLLESAAQLVREATKKIPLYSGDEQARVELARKLRAAGS